MCGWLAARSGQYLIPRCGNIATVEPVGRWWAAVPRERWPTEGSEARAAIEQNLRQPYGDRINEVVFIGRNMDQELVEKAFAQCQLQPAEIRRGMSSWCELPDQFPDWIPVEAQVEEVGEAL